MMEKKPNPNLVKSPNIELHSSIKINKQNTNRITCNKETKEVVVYSSETKQSN